MAFTPEDIAKVRESADFVAIASEKLSLKKKGDKFWANCPFHGEKTPSFCITPATNLYYCFGCGQGGDLIDYVEKTEHLSFYEAVKELAERTGIELKETGARIDNSKRSRQIEMCALAQQFYSDQLLKSKSPAADQARSYLKARGMDAQICKDWKIGLALSGKDQESLANFLHSKSYSAEEMTELNLAVKYAGKGLSDRFFNRIMFPIYDATAHPIAFGGRVLGEGEPKYLNSSDTPLFSKSRVLYGLDRAKSGISNSNCAIVCEGYTDTIALHLAGFTNAVASLGTAFTVEHLKSLKRFSHNIIFLFDGDDAGKRAARRAAEIANSLEVRQLSTDARGNIDQLTLRVCILPDKLDPADYLIQFGSDKLKQLIKSPAAAPEAIRYMIDSDLAEVDLSSAPPSVREQALMTVLPHLLYVKDTILAADYINYLADIFNTSEDMLKAKLRTLSGKRPVKTAEHTQVVESSIVSSGHSASLSLKGGKATLAPILQYEVELIAVLINQPKLRAKLNVTFAKLSWNNDTVRDIVLAAKDLDDSLSPKLYTAKLLEMVPKLPALLAYSQYHAAINDSADNAKNLQSEPADYIKFLLLNHEACELELTLANLKRQIRMVDEAAPEYTQIFEDTVKTQQKLTRLKAQI